MKRRSGLLVLAALVSLSGLTATPALAGPQSIYMTSNSCPNATCAAIVVMQVRGDRIRYQMSMAQAGGTGSIGWMQRHDNAVTGLVGGDCSASRETKTVIGRGSRTHFAGMRLVTRTGAEAFARRRGVTMPDWPWLSRKEWKRNQERFGC